MRRLLLVLPVVLCRLGAVLADPAPLGPDAFKTSATFAVDDAVMSLSSALAADPGRYNASHAAIQLTIDRDGRVWQVDMSVPGHGCTIAPFEPEVRAFLQNYRLTGQKLRLKSSGSHVCDMKFMGIANQKFAWNSDLDVPAFVKDAK